MMGSPPRAVVQAVLVAGCMFACLWAQPIVRGEPIDYSAPVNLRRFADSLWESGDFLRAAGEYQRYLFHEPQATAALTQRVAQCYRQGGRPDLAISYLEVLLDQSLSQLGIHSARYSLGETYFHLGRYAESVDMLRAVESPYWPEAQQLMGLSYLMQRQWEKANLHFTSLDLASFLPEQRKKVLAYRNLAREGVGLPRKSPLAAGMLSALIPGAGRLYADRPSDAMMTALVLGLAGWQAVDGFRDGGSRSVKGWFFGVSGSVFYFANVYGSIVATNEKNRDTETTFLARVPIP